MIPVLTTKIYKPNAHPDRVLRRHVIPRLDEELWHIQGSVFARRLTLVAAPAGYGKTTLLCEWIDHLKVPAAWITFDSTDDHPIYFLQYLIAALQTVEPGIGASILSSLESFPVANLEAVISSTLTSLVNELTRLPKPCFLILDDYHHLESPEIHKAVMYLLDHLPGKLSLVISTRVDPPIFLSRLRTNRQLLEIRSEHLRFSESEASSFFQQVMHLNLTDPDIEILTDKTEGWIAGLQMAALALQSRKDASIFIQEFSGRKRFVIDYLFEEVLSRQSDDIQTFLIQTSILDRMTGPLCDAVLQKRAPDEISIFPSPSRQENLSNSGQEMLEHLERSNLFLVPLDDERRFYRYHHLFLDLLRHRLRKSYPDLLPDLHLQAAEWLETNGFTSDALDHLLAAGDYLKAANLITRKGFHLLEQGNFSQMLSWLEQVPRDLFESQSWLCIFYSWGLIFTGRFSEGEAYIAMAEKILPPIDEATDPDAFEQYGNLAALHEYLVSRSHDAQGIIHYANLAGKYLHSDSFLIRSIIAFFLGHGRVLSDQYELARKAFHESIEFGKKARNMLLTVNALCALANLTRLQGELRQAFAIYQEAISACEDEHGGMLPVAADAYVGRARLYYQWNDLSQAERDLLTACDKLKYYINFDLFVDCKIAQSRLHLAQGDLKKANLSIQELGQDQRQISLRPGVTLLSHQVDLYLAEQNLVQAAHLTDQQDWNMEEKCFYAWAEAFVAYARSLIARNELSRAYHVLDKLLTEVMACGLEFYVIEAQVVQAAILYLQGDHSLAQSKLDGAISLAEPQGFIRIFLDQGEPVRLLLVDYQATHNPKGSTWGKYPNNHLNYVDQILSAFSGDTAERPEIQPAAAPSEANGLVNQLTEREIEILRLIIGGLSNKEIAEKLVISVGTVKAHTSSIYRKLDVEGRTKAIARAREIRFL